MSTDYTQADLFFKFKKTVRYIALYGLTRTIAKVRGQYHMRATDGFDGSRWDNNACKTADVPDRNVAIIGCGNFAFSNIAFYLRKGNSRFLRATFDTERRRSLSLCKAYGGAYAASDWKDILLDPRVRIVFIASNHASHADYAVACLRAGKHVHIEKPHVVSQTQLGQLVAAMRGHPESKVFLGFNRPKGRLFGMLRDKLAAESGPLMINWFVAGHEIADGHWYFDEREGGRVLGNLCHWSDLILHLVTLEKAFPCTIASSTPAGSKSDFVVTTTFADGSCAVITFSAKGHAFEGVREVLNVHKGRVLANLTDFHVLTVDVLDKKKRIQLRHRDHGHAANILHSINAVSHDRLPGEDIFYVTATAKFFLAIRDSLDSGRPLVLSLEEINRSLQ